MDADDEAFPERLQIQSNYLAEHPEYAAVGAVEYVSHIQKSEGFNNYVNWVNGITVERHILLKQHNV